MNASTLVCRLPAAGTTWIGNRFDDPDASRDREPDSVQQFGLLPIGSFVRTRNDMANTEHCRARPSRCQPDAVQASEPAA